jgi:hypothetical protein
MEHLYKIFNKQALAQAYADQESTRILPLGPEDETRRYAIPIELEDGRWVVGCADDDASCVPWDKDWVLKDVAG